MLSRGGQATCSTADFAAFVTAAGEQWQEEDLAVVFKATNASTSFADGVDGNGGGAVTLDALEACLRQTCVGGGTPRDPPTCTASWTACKPTRWRLQVNLLYTYVTVTVINVNVTVITCTCTVKYLRYRRY